MRKLFALAVVCFASSYSLFALNPVGFAQWTFETSAFTSISNVGTAPLSTSIAPEVGSGAATGLHASSATVWSAPTGDGSPKGFSADHYGRGIGS